MSETQVQERRRFIRFRGNPEVRATVAAEGKHSTGIVLNVSRGGAYLLTEAFDFEEGQVNFHCPGGQVLSMGCRLVDPVRQGGESMGIAFTWELSEEEVSLLKAAGYEE